MRTRLFLAATVAALGLVGGSAAAAPHASAPPRKSGYYSFSQHHSGTCSGHGGVAIFYR